jgi:hypothetical protein
MTNYHLKEATSNKKLTGLKPQKLVSATTSSWLTCSKYCPLFNKCYAKKGPQSWNANKVTRNERGYNFNTLIKEIEQLRTNSFLRLNVSGDLPSENYINDVRKIDKEALNKIYLATRKTNTTTYTYTHLHCDKKNKEYNLNAVKEHSKENFVINISTEIKKNALKHYFNGHDVVITNTKLFNEAVKHQIETGKQKQLKTDKGTVELFPCDAQYKESNCSKCRKCSEYNRSEIVIFKEH